MLQLKKKQDFQWRHRPIIIVMVCYCYEYEHKIDNTAKDNIH